MNPATPIIASRLFEFSDDIRSVMVVEVIGNVISFVSCTERPVDPQFVN